MRSTTSGVTKRNGTAVIKITDKLVITGTDHESIGTILFFIVSFVRPCRSKMHPEGFFHEKNRYLHPLAFSVQLSGEPDCNTGKC